MLLRARLPLLLLAPGAHQTRAPAPRTLRSPFDRARGRARCRSVARRRRSPRDGTRRSTLAPRRRASRFRPGDARAADLPRMPTRARDYELVRAFPASAAGRFRAFAALGEAEMLFNARARGRRRRRDAGRRSTWRAPSHDSSAEVLALLSLGILRLRNASPEVALATLRLGRARAPRRRSRAPSARSLRSRDGARAKRAPGRDHRSEIRRTARATGRRAPRTSPTACTSPPAATSDSAASTRPIVFSTPPPRSRARSATGASSRRFSSGAATRRSSVSSSIPRSGCWARRSPRARRREASRRSHGLRSISRRCLWRSTIRSPPKRT